MYYSSNTFNVRILIISALCISFFSGVAFPKICSAHLFSNLAKDYHLKGYDQQLKGNYPGALSFYYKAVAAEPDNCVYQNDIGLVYEHMNRLDSAERSYLAALEANPRYLPPYANLGYLNLKKQNLAKAIYFFQKRVELGVPGDPWTKKAKRELEKIYLSAPHLREKFMQAESRRLNAQVLKKNQRDFQNQIRVANAEYKRGQKALTTQRPGDALKAFNTSLAFAPGNPKVLRARRKAVREHRQEQIARRVKKAMRMVDDGDEQAAEKQFEEILTIIPNHPR